jgi:hypothetical protein
MRLRQTSERGLRELAHQLNECKENEGLHLAESVVYSKSHFDYASAIGCEAVFHMACDTGNASVENALQACFMGLKAIRKVLPCGWAMTVACLVRLHFIRLSVAHWAGVPGERVCMFVEEALGDCSTHPGLLACLIAGLKLVPRSHLLCTWFDRHLLLQDTEVGSDGLEELLLLAGGGSSSTVGGGGRIDPRQQQHQQRPIVWAFGVVAQIERALRRNKAGDDDGGNTRADQTFRHWVRILLGDNGWPGEPDSDVDQQVDQQHERQRRAVTSRIREWLVLATTDRSARKCRLFWSQLARLELQDGKPDVCKQVMSGAIQRFVRVFCVCR